MQKKVLIMIFFITAALTCLTPTFAAEVFSSQNLLDSNETYWKNNPTLAWDQLQHTSLHRLNETLMEHSHDELTAWAQLAILGKEYSSNKTKLINALLDWRKKYPEHIANSLFPDDSILEKILATPQKKHVAVLLPLSGSFAVQGKVIRDGILAGYYEQYTLTHHEQIISIYDTNHFPSISDAYQKAIKEGADFVIGPLTKKEVKELAKLSSFAVPTLALNYTDRSSPTSQFYEFGLSTKDEAEQAALKAFEAGSTEAIVIASNKTKSTAQSFINKWQALGGHIIESYYYPNRADLSLGIAKLLKINDHDDRETMKVINDKNILAEQRRHDFDMIFLSASASDARIIVPLLKYYYAEDVPIYSLSTIHTNGSEIQKDKDLNGVFIPYIPYNSNKNAEANQTKRLFAVGHDAYLLSHDLERLEQLPNFPIYAETGALTLNSGQIYRRLPWTKIHANKSKS